MVSCLQQSLLKCFQRLHYFPPLELTPEIIITHVKQCLKLENTVRAAYDRPKTMYRHQQLIREWLEIEPHYGNRKARALAAGTALRIAAMIDPVDIVNAMLGELQRERIELPAYSTLDRLADRAHAAADHRLFSWVMRHLAEDLRKKLSDLLLVDTDQQLSAFQAVKASAKNATLSHLEERLNHLQWLESLGQMDRILAGIPPAKIRSFAQEAKALDIAEVKDYQEPQRLTLMLCLVQRACVRTRDDIAEMFLRRMTAVHRRAKEELQKIQFQQRQRTEKLIETLDSMLAVLYSQEDALAAAFEIKSLVGDKKRIEELRVECAAIRAWSKNNYLPLLWNQYRSHRQALLKVLRSLRLDTATADGSLLRAIEVVLTHAARAPHYLDTSSVDLAFASDRWKKLVVQESKGTLRLDRRQLEVCVFSCLMAELRSGDMTVWGSESFADHREQCSRRRSAQSFSSITVND